jgi:hypothetical protein
MAENDAPRVDPPKAGPVANTAVTGTAAAVAVAIVALIASIISSQGGELTMPTHDAILLLLTIAIGWPLHSVALREDRMAVHQWVLSRFGYRPTMPTQVPLPPGGAETPVRPSPMGDVR